MVGPLEATQLRPVVDETPPEWQGIAGKEKSFRMVEMPSQEKSWEFCANPKREA